MGYYYIARGTMKAITTHLSSPSLGLLLPSLWCQAVCLMWDGPCLWEVVKLV